ncbi:MAG: HD domain-containing protein [Sulfurovum sp.]|nr:HD domain-containing protein [Sulfurovum sp.]
MRESMKLPDILQTIAKELQAKGAHALLVGGAVRDMVMGQAVKDYDIEVYGLDTLETLESVLSAYGSVNQVGKSFGIVKLRAGEEEYDFSFPRKETKTGKGHRGFDVTVDGTLTFKEAAKRRDFTVNALGYDILTGEILDPFGGLQDIQYKVLRHIDDATFIEDPLRVYRAVQFAARFGFEVAEETAVLCKKMVAEGMLEELPKERVYEEWKKLLLKSPKPSIGFELMRSWEIVKRYFPELHALVGCLQDVKWHPEGDVWVHTMLSLDVMAMLLREQGAGSREREDLKLLFAVLCHDLGKPLTTTIELENGEIIEWKELQKNKSVSIETHTNTPHSSLFTLHSIRRIRAISHETAGIEPTRTFLYRLTNEHDFIESILPLVEHHLKPSQFYAQGAKAGAIRRLATKVNIEELVWVAAADHLGRDKVQDVIMCMKEGESFLEMYPAGRWLMEQAEALHVKEKPLEPLIRGRDLIAMGMKPSPRFKEILDAVYALQLDGAFPDKEAALEYVKRHKNDW